MKKSTLIVLLVLAVIININTTGMAQEKKGKVIYYRNPMNGSITSKVPMKDEMGMDFIPVYESEAASTPATSETGVATVTLNATEIASAQVKTIIVAKRSLVKEIRAFGRIAYDPDLLVAQQEYLSIAEAGQDPELKNIAKNKLRLLGMSDVQISELEQAGKAQENLILPGHSAWVYADIYQDDMGLLKTGSPVLVNTDAVPGEEFTGTIKAIDPVVNEMTRSVKIRAEVVNHQLNLKPGMYVTVLIHISLGEGLAIPKEAVIDTGRQKIVWVEKSKGLYERKQVVVGPEAQDYYPVLQGLQTGEKVVTRGNFLIDSQSIISGGSAESSYSGAITGTEKKNTSAPARQRHQH